MDELDSIIQMIDDDMDAAPAVQWEMPHVLYMERTT